MITCPDCSAAATQAVRALLKYHMDSLPVYPQKIIQEYPRASMLSFADLAAITGTDREELLRTAHPSNEAAATFVFNQPDGPYYLFAFNREQPIDRIRFALSVQVGNVMLGHVGFRPEDVRLKEAFCFARHFCWPRPLIRLMQEYDIPLQESVLAMIAGNYGSFIRDLQTEARPASVPADLNRQVKEMLRPQLLQLLSTGLIPSSPVPDEPMLDLSTYMEGYVDE